MDFIWIFSINSFRELERTQTKPVLEDLTIYVSCRSEWKKKLHVLPRRAVPAQSDQCTSNYIARRIPVSA